MTEPRSPRTAALPAPPGRWLPSWLLLTGGLGVVVAAMAWLMFSIAGHRQGMQSFPTEAGSKLEFLLDDGQTDSFAEIRTLPDEAWREWQGKYLEVKPEQALWVKVTLVNPSRVPVNGVLADSEYLTDRVEAWIKGRDGAWQSLRSGEEFRGAEKPIWSRTAAFPVHLEPEERATVFLRVTDFYTGVPWFRWWPRADDFFQALLRDILAEAICYGMLLALLIYNFVLWVRLRFPDTGCYVLYAGAMLAFNFASNGGLALLGLAVGSPWKEMITAGALAASGLFFVQFARIFLGTQKVMPRADRLLKGVFALLLALLAGVGLMPFGVGPGWFDLLLVGVALSHLLLLALGLLAWVRGVHHARYFIAAFGLLFAGAIPAIVAWLGGDMQAWAAMALLAVSALEMLMLSFAVADRFAQTQRQLLEETEQRRMMQESYADELELEVSERTRELADAAEAKDRMLSVLGHDLRSPITGLIRAADGMKEPQGALAGEVAQTGRALLRLIEDLLLWTHLREVERAPKAHDIDEITGPAVALHGSEAGQRQVRLSRVVPEGFEVVRVQTDLVLAQTLMRNLLSNALKWATREVELRVEQAPDEEVRFVVINDGVSFPEAVLACLDEGRSAEIPGGRMGLRLCMEICEILGTRLEARNLAAGGVSVSFVLPRAEEAATLVPSCV